MQAHRQRGVEYQKVGLPFELPAAAPDSKQSKPGDVRLVLTRTLVRLAQKAIALFAFIAIVATIVCTRYTWAPSHSEHWFDRHSVLEDNGGFQPGDRLWLVFEASEAIARRGAFENWGRFLLLLRVISVAWLQQCDCGSSCTCLRQARSTSLKN